MFSHSGKPTGIVITSAHYLKHPAGWKTAGNLVRWFSAKIIKIVATSCKILRLKCTKFYFRWGSAPEPAGSLQRSPIHLAGFKGPTCLLLRGGEGRAAHGRGGEREERGRERRGGGKGNGRKGEGLASQIGESDPPLPLSVIVKHQTLLV